MKTIETTLKYPFFIIILVSLGVIFQSCDKKKAGKLTGSYNCNVVQTTFTEPLENGDSWTEISIEKVENIEVKSNAEFVEILGHSIHIDSLKNENLYVEYCDIPSCSLFKLRFKEDSVFITVKSGGLGGYVIESYKGVK